MSFTVGTIQGTLPRLMAGRTLLPADMADWIRKAVLELTEDYKFQGLQTSGPVVQLTTGNAGPYPFTNFLSTGDAGIVDINKINSFFLYYNVPAFPLTITNGENPGYPLRFKTIDDMEMELNILGLPIHWTRFNDEFYFGFAPQMPYSIYCRYQKEHPFPNAGTVNAGNDPILMPNSWQDIVEYCSAERAANELRLYDIATGYHNAVFGDPKFQLTGGTEGTPGLIFHRTSQEQRDQTTTTKQMRLASRSCMRR
jgi:hypothetical protein